MSKTNCFTWV